MKRILNNFLAIATLCVVLFSSTSCLKDDPMFDWDAAIPVIELPYKSHYLTSSKVTPEKNVSFNLMVNYTIPFASDNKEDIKVGLKVDESLVSVYNASLASTAKKYELLPAGTYNLPSEITIAKGTQLWKQDLEINTSSLTPKTYYILPVVISSAPQGYTISGNFGHVYLRVQMN